MHLSFLSWWRAAVILAVFAAPGCALTPMRESVEPVNQVIATPLSVYERDIQTLIGFGPRVAGSPAAEQASTYLQNEYRKAGYETQIQAFTYRKFEDLGSNLTIDQQSLAGRALGGSIAATVTAPLVVVPNEGREEDYRDIDVKGAIAIVRRGKVRFLEKARQAAAAGAVGVVIVNSEPGQLLGVLAGEVEIPVMSVARDRGQALIEQVQRSPITAQLRVDTRYRTITGRNVIARLPGVIQPRLILGAHFDSVVGSPGANDNASGTAVILNLARQVARTPVGKDVWFVAFDGEEDGLHGSRAFVEQTEPTFRQQLQGMLNFDMVGVAVSDKLLLGGSESLTKLANTLANASETVEISGKAMAGSDHESFADVGVPVLFFHRGIDPNYHQPTDTVVDPKQLENTANFALDLIQQLLVEKT